MLTGQLVVAQTEERHRRAPPELRRNVACAARRSFLVFCLLVYQNCNQVSFWRTGQLIVAEVKAHQPGQLPNLGRDGACQRIFGLKTISGRLVYQTG